MCSQNVPWPVAVEAPHVCPGQLLDTQAVVGAREHDGCRPDAQPLRWCAGAICDDAGYVTPATGDGLVVGASARSGARREDGSWLAVAELAEAVLVVGQRGRLPRSSGSGPHPAAAVNRARGWPQWPVSARAGLDNAYDVRAAQVVRTTWPLWRQVQRKASSRPSPVDRRRARLPAAEFPERPIRTYNLMSYSGTFSRSSIHDLILQ